MATRQKLYITLSPKAKVLLKKLAESRGMSQSAYIEQFVRNESERLEITATDKEVDEMAG
jgi:hypothetical protein